MINLRDARACHDLDIAHRYGPAGRFRGMLFDSDQNLVSTILGGSFVIDRKGAALIHNVLCTRHHER